MGVKLPPEGEIPLAENETTDFVNEGVRVGINILFRPAPHGEVTDISVEKVFVFEMASFRDVMGDGAGDGVVDPRPGHIGEKFGDDIAVFRLLDVLAIGPCTEVVGLFHLLVGDFDQREILLEEGEGRAVGDRVDLVLGTFGAEGVDILCDGFHKSVLLKTAGVRASSHSRRILSCPVCR